MSIQKYQANSELAKVQQAIEGRKIRDTPDNELHEAIKQAYKVAIAKAGVSRYDPEMVKSQILLTIEDIRQDFQGLTIEEINFAFRQGVVGKYGDYHGINPKTAYNWLLSYRNSRAKGQAQRQKVKALQSPYEPKKLTEAEKNEFIADEWAYYQQHGHCHGTNLLFDILKDRGEFDVYDPVFQKDCRKRARQIRTARKKEAAGSKVLRSLVERYDDESGDAFRSLMRAAAVYLVFDVQI